MKGLALAFKASVLSKLHYIGQLINNPVAWFVCLNFSFLKRKRKELDIYVPYIYNGALNSSGTHYQLDIEGKVKAFNIKIYHVTVRHCHQLPLRHDKLIIAEPGRISW